MMQLSRGDALLRGSPLYRLDKRLDKEVSSALIVVGDPVLSAISLAWQIDRKTLSSFYTKGPNLLFDLLRKQFSETGRVPEPLYMELLGGRGSRIGVT
jgi:hypothetical protein